MTKPNQLTATNAEINAYWAAKAIKAANAGSHILARVYRENAAKYMRLPEANDFFGGCAGNACATKA